MWGLPLISGDFSWSFLGEISWTETGHVEEYDKGNVLFYFVSGAFSGGWISLAFLLIGFGWALKQVALYFPTSVFVVELVGRRVMYF